MVEGGVHVSTLPDDLLDQKPTIQEVTTHARTAYYNLLGVTLQLDSVKLAGCCDYTSMYQLWIMEKAENATRRNLLVALRAIRQNNEAKEYEKYLETIVSYILHTLMYIHVHGVDPLAKNSLILLHDIDLHLNLTLIVTLVAILVY